MAKNCLLRDTMKRFALKINLTRHAIILIFRAKKLSLLKMLSPLVPVLLKQLRYLIPLIQLRYFF